MRSRRITRKEVHQAPTWFLMVALLAKVPVGSPLNCHLVCTTDYEIEAIAHLFKSDRSILYIPLS